MSLRLSVKFLFVLAFMHASHSVPQAPANTPANTNVKTKLGKACVSKQGQKGVYDAQGICGPILQCTKAGQACIWPECTAYPCPYYFYVTAGVCDKQLVCQPRHQVPITEGDK